MSRTTSRTATGSPGPLRHGLFRRGRDAAGPADWTCPDCGLTCRDPVIARLGFCARCGDFTGMCGAGRRIVCPDMMTVTSWHLPCTRLGAVAWQLSQGATARVAMLCPEHDRQLRDGNAAWISSAVPLAELPRA